MSKVNFKDDIGDTAPGVLPRNGWLEPEEDEFTTIQGVLLGVGKQEYSRPRRLKVQPLPETTKTGEHPEVLVFGETGDDADFDLLETIETTNSPPEDPIVANMTEQIEALKDERVAVLKQLELWGDKCCQLEDESHTMREKHEEDIQKLKKVILLQNQKLKSSEDHASAAAPTSLSKLLEIVRARRRSVKDQKQTQNKTGTNKNDVSWKAEALSKRNLCSALELQLKATTGQISALRQQIELLKSNPCSDKQYNFLSEEVSLSKELLGIPQEESLSNAIRSLKIAIQHIPEISEDSLGLESIKKLSHVNDTYSLDKNPCEVDLMNEIKSNLDSLSTSKVTLSREPFNQNIREIITVQEEQINALELQIKGQKDFLSAQRQEHGRILSDLNMKVEEVIEESKQLFNSSSVNNEIWTPLVEALRDYSANKPTELCVSKGERFNLLCDEDSETWLIARRSKHDALDSVGYAPASLFDRVYSNPLNGLLEKVSTVQTHITEEFAAIGLPKVEIPANVAEVSHKSENQNLKIVESTNWEDLPQGWERAVDYLGCIYFVNHLTKETTWLHPVTKRPMQPTQFPFVQHDSHRPSHQIPATPASAEELIEVETLLATLIEESDNGNHT